MRLLLNLSATAAVSLSLLAMTTGSAMAQVVTPLVTPLGTPQCDHNPIFTWPVTFKNNSVTNTSFTGGNLQIPDGTDKIEALGICYINNCNDTVRETISPAGLPGPLTFNPPGGNLLFPYVDIYIRVNGVLRTTLQSPIAAVKNGEEYKFSLAFPPYESCPKSGAGGTLR